MVYGRPALVAAVDLRLTARLAPLSDALPDRVRLELPALGLGVDTSWGELREVARLAREGWERYAEEPSPERFRALRGHDPAHVVKVALGEALESLGDDPPGAGHLRVVSSLPVGSGFGSSAATATAVIAACLVWRSAPLDPARIERLALEVERRQHGFPSGVDTATVVRGGLLWARKTDAGLEVESVESHSPLLSRLRVYDTGTPPEPTGVVVAAVRARSDRHAASFERLLDRMEGAARGLHEELAAVPARPHPNPSPKGEGEPATSEPLSFGRGAGVRSQGEDPARVLELIRECEACLEELGVVPEPVRGVVRRIEGAGGAAKISGAGSLSGPGAGSLLVYHPEPESISGWRFLEPFPFHSVQLGAAGLRQETDA